MFVSTTQYVYNSPSTHSIEQPSIHQPKGTDVVIITLGALGRWSHRCKSEQLNAKGYVIYRIDRSDPPGATRSEKNIFSMNSLEGLQNEVEVRLHTPLPDGEKLLIDETDKDADTLEPRSNLTNSHLEMDLHRKTI